MAVTSLMATTDVSGTTPARHASHMNVLPTTDAFSSTIAELTEIKNAQPKARHDQRPNFENVKRTRIVPSAAGADTQIRNESFSLIP